MIEIVNIPEDRMKKLRELKGWRSSISKFLDLKIELGDSVIIESDDPISVLKGKAIFQAFGRGFDFKDAMNLIDEDYKLEILNVKEFSGKSKNRQHVLKGRVIGTGGTSKELIERRTNVKIAVYGKTISIIGKWDDVARAKDSIERLLMGSKHSSVARSLAEDIRNF